MIRILHILHSMNRGGAEAMLMNYYRNIDREQVQFDFLLTEQNHCQYEDEIEAMGGKVYRVPLLTFSNPWPYIRGVKKFLKSHPEYKIVHSHTSSKSAVPLWVAKKCGVPVRVCHAHSSDSGSGIEGIIRGALCIWLKRVATDFFACGEDASRCWYGDKITDSARSKVVTNAVDTVLYGYDEALRDSIRTRYQICKDALVLGMVSRFHPVKNHLFALDVLKVLVESRQNVVLMLVGDGELRQEIQEKAKRLGVDSHLIMAGVVPDVYKYLQAMDVVLMPSFNEGLPVSMVEAQVSGLRCIVSTGVPKEVDVTGNVTFLPLELDSWDESIRSMQPGWRDPEAKNKVARAGYDIQEAAKELEKWYIDRSNNQ